jgi:nucleoside-diphosphate kinase
METTFAMIKPDAVAAGLTGTIIDLIEKNGFVISFMQKVQLTELGAHMLYEGHNSRDFFNRLVDFITSGPVVLMTLTKENAVDDWRALMGATSPMRAEEGTIRKLYGTDIERNAVHGSDSVETAKHELKIFFGPPPKKEEKDEDSKGSKKKKSKTSASIR